MTVTTITLAAAPAAIASAVTAASRVLFLGTEGPNALPRCRSIRIAAGRDFFKDTADLRLFGADAEPGVVRTIAARVVAEQAVAPSLIILEHPAFASLGEADLRALFPSANVVRISG